VATVEWKGDGVRLIDQTKLPDEESYVTCRSAAMVATAIRNMVVRGAPAIGAAAAQRSAYVRYLTRRLEAPRDFVEEAERARAAA